jgi:hypothetical protein
MLFQHLGDDHLSLTAFEDRHEPKSAGKLLRYPDMHRGELNGLAWLHAQAGGGLGLVFSAHWRLCRNFGGR